MWTGSTVLTATEMQKGLYIAKGNPCQGKLW